ncbi:receptor-like serine/threonine-protein kinase SD1-8-like protein [Trifolium pratense]|uniref:Receptor-like serine/threonine-protein kinase SD1-8-like protein n=1 Tax=Trifolium pratense TaxID=57577 RepID=A0A2K3KY21_TRIPR|nr:receptor-like serine/threonine-protein kinase SD1-8-like protein [Trifolium pratense]
MNMALTTHFILKIDQFSRDWWWIRLVYFNVELGLKVVKLGQLFGFSPKNEQAWKLRDGSDGCVRNTNLDCESDKFYHMENVKLPETSSVFVNMTMGIDECGDLCHRNCSCTGYAYVTTDGSGCVMWFGILFDIRSYSDGGQDLFVRLAASDIGDDCLYFINTNPGNLATDVGLLSTPPRAQRYWAWGADINGE